jgi:hypothetical protein
MKLAAIAVLLLSSLAFAQTTPAPKTFITGVGNFVHVVEDQGRSLTFYRDAIGLQITDNPRFRRPNQIRGMDYRDRGDAFDRLLNVPGADNAFLALSIPGSTIGVELASYRNVAQTPVHPRVQDPGAANLIVGLRDIASVLEKVRKIPGATILSSEGGKTALLQDPDGFMVELVAMDAPGRGNVVGGGIELTIENTDRRNSRRDHPTEPRADPRNKRSDRVHRIFRGGAQTAEDSPAGSRHGDASALCSRFEWLDEGTQKQRCGDHFERR